MPRAVKYSQVVGIDIGPSKIVAMALKKTKEGVLLTHFASCAMPPDSFKDGAIVDPKAVGEVIRKLFSKEGIQIKDVVVGCAGPGVILHLSKFPLMGQREIREALKAQFSKFVVFAGFETASDYHVFETVAEAGAKKIKILAVAGKKALLDSYVLAIRAAGLNLIKIDENSLAITRALYDQSINISAKESIVMVAISYDFTMISIYRDGRLFYIHPMTNGIKGQEDIKGFLAKFISELDSILAYYRSQFGPDTEIKKIVLGGEVESILKLRKSSDEKLTVSGIVVEIPDPLKDIPSEKKGMVEGFEEAPQLLSRVFGLTLSGLGMGQFPIQINLLPLGAIRQREFNKQLRLLAFLCVGLVALCVLVLAGLQMSLHSIREKIRVSQNIILNSPSSFDELIMLEQRYRKNLEEIALQDKFFTQIDARPWHEVLGEIRTVIPKDARLTSLTISREDTIIISGEAKIQESVFNFERVLKRSPYFENVKLVVVQDKQGLRGLVYFNMAFRLRAQEKTSESE